MILPLEQKSSGAGEAQAVRVRVWIPGQRDARCKVCVCYSSTGEAATGRSLSSPTSQSSALANSVSRNKVGPLS